MSGTAQNFAFSHLISCCFRDIFGTVGEKKDHN